MIYALLDKEVLLKRGLSLELLSKKIEMLNVPIAQYRNKSGSLAEKRKDLQLIKTYYRGQLIVNDAIELIDEADGLHIGQEDIRAFSANLSEAITAIRAKIGTKTLGLSTHNQEEIMEANGLDLDYIGLGAYRGTNTKREAKVLGEKALELAKYSKHPVGLIGGVKLNDVFEEQITYRVIGSDLYEN
ncbi:MAG: thiamine phosphate synthase [Epsilonproteobacteria bacterium]|nr:thiamine phosphate synthase [Campylobacterota bacterium]